MSEKITKITSDGGVTKKILKEGEGAVPAPGSTVGVDGTEFDSSSGGYPFTFELGKGEVIKGWDRGIATMKIGEKAILTIAPQYGYGSEDSDDIPANSTLIFEVELVSAQKTATKGPTVQVNADMARLEQIRKEREEAAEQRKREVEAKAAALKEAQSKAAAAKSPAKDKKGKKK